MSIELRKRGSRSYVTRTTRMGTKIVKRHVGTLTDPAADFVFRTNRLTKATRQADIKHLDHQRGQDKLIERTMDLLVSFSRCWHVLYLLAVDEPPAGTIPMNRDTGNSQRLSNSLGQLPDTNAFKRLCRAADRGDSHAQAALDDLVAESDVILQEVFSPTGTARRLVTDSLAGESYFLRQVIDQRLSEVISHFETTNKDPLTRMYAEVTAIAWLDACRCSVAAVRETRRRADGKYEQSLADRACRRFQRIAAAMERHRERMAKQVSHSR